MKVRSCRKTSMIRNLWTPHFCRTGKLDSRHAQLNGAQFRTCASSGCIPSSKLLGLLKKGNNIQLKTDLKTKRDADYGIITSDPPLTRVTRPNVTCFPALLRIRCVAPDSRCVAWLRIATVVLCCCNTAVRKVIILDK